MRAVPGVAQTLGQDGVQGHGGTVVAEAGRGGPAREAEARQGRDHHVEGVGRVRPVAGGVGQQRDELGHLGEAAGPAVHQHDGEGVGARARLVDEVEVDAVHRGPELGELVEARLDGPPVVALQPVVHELAEVADVDAVVPRGAIGHVDPAGASQPVVEVVQDGLVHVDAIGLDVHTASPGSAPGGPGGEDPSQAPPPATGSAPRSGLLRRRAARATASPAGSTSSAGRPRPRAPAPGSSGSAQGRGARDRRRGRGSRWTGPRPSRSRSRRPGCS